MPKKIFFNLSIIARLSLGLVALIVSLFLTTDMIFNIIPDEEKIKQSHREVLAKGLAIQLVSLLEPSNNQTSTLRKTLQEVASFHPEIISIGIRKFDGSLLYETTNHRQHWQLNADGASTPENFRVPINANNSKWGSIEISFKTNRAVNLLDWLIQSKALWLMAIASLSAVLIYFYLRRVLQYLDPLKTVPTRVNDAFDIIDDGILVLDKKGQIVLANQAFTSLLTTDTESLYGKNIANTKIIKPILKSIPEESMPWNAPPEKKMSLSDVNISIAGKDNSTINLLVSSAAINDDKQSIRGYLVTFKNISELYTINQKLNKTLNDLQRSRKQLELNNQQLQEMAYRDPLTGCLNRRAFFQQAEDIYLSALQGNRELFCIMADIDFFKSFNDIYGHYVGDQIIQIVAKIFKTCLRPSDLICRYGGEEFCILLSDLTYDEVSEVCERVRKTIEETASKSVRTVNIKPVTTSFGIASINSGANSIENLIDYADSALYISKQSGRNQVTHWSSTILN